MKILYIECKMGIAGDMLMAALYELLDRKQQLQFLHQMNALMPDDIIVTPEQSSKCGIAGTHMHIQIQGTTEHAHVMCENHAHMSDHHSHHTYASILENISQLSLPEDVICHVRSVYQLLGEAESYVHQTSIEQIHFHEVGSLDALIDIVGCCYLFSMLSPDAILASPIHVGNGTVHCAHGILPVPAPATAKLLENIPFYTGEIDAELCTPTGAALLHHFCKDFTTMPVMKLSHVGIGLGTKDFSAANCVRVFWGEVQDAHTDTIWDLSCNIDDMTGEELGFCMEVLLQKGALDVFYQSIQMKKNRPGILLHCFCRNEDKERFVQLIFKHTSTRGIRFQEYSRAVLSAEFEEIQTDYGIIRQKKNSGYGIQKSKPEYEDIRKLALDHDLSLDEMRKLYSHEIIF